MKSREEAEEQFDLLTHDGQPTGAVGARSHVHRAGLWHASFHAFVVFTSDDGAPTGLFQLRSKRKRSFPGKIDATTTGHLSAGESVADGVREIREEIGLDVNFEELIPLGQRRWAFIDPTIDREDREIHHVFLLPRKIDPQQVCLQESEVDALIAVDLREGVRWGDGEIHRLPFRRWAARPGYTFQSPMDSGFLSRDDFVTVTDRYFDILIKAGLDCLIGRLPAYPIFTLESS